MVLPVPRIPVSQGLFCPTMLSILFWKPVWREGPRVFAPPVLQGLSQAFALACTNATSRRAG